MFLWLRQKGQATLFEVNLKKVVEFHACLLFIKMVLEKQETLQCRTLLQWEAADQARRRGLKQMFLCGL